jgi:hypothetical protein
MSFIDRLWLTFSIWDFGMKVMLTKQLDFPKEEQPTHALSKEEFVIHPEIDFISLDQLRTRMWLWNEGKADGGCRPGPESTYLSWLKSI